MPYRRKNSGATDRVLESRHVIGLFALLLLFSGIFFALGFVMGRGQYDGSVIAGSHPIKGGVDHPYDAPKPLPGNHPNKNGVSAGTPVASSPASTPPPAETNPGWDIHESDNSAKNFPASDAKPPVTIARQKTAPAVKNTNVVVAAHGRPAAAPLIPTGSYTLQVAALKSQSDALEIAKSLQKKKFPSFVLSPQGDKFYRVQVGPYSDQKSADAAKKGLDAAGFKAIVKH